MNSLFTIVDIVLNLYMWIVIAYVVVGLLIAFGVVNAYNRAVNVIYEFLTRVTEPVLRPIRRLLPRTGQIDLSPLVLMLLLIFIRILLHNNWPSGGISTTTG